MANQTQVAAFNALDPRGCGFRVEFFRTADRYGHRVLAATSRSAAELWESIEGDASQTWPASPALQALNIDQVNKQGGPAALVGMSGGAHWSLSVERMVVPGEVQLVFDAACRAKTLPEQITSRYRLGSELECQYAKAKQDAQWTAGDQRWRVLTLPIENESIAAPVLSIEQGHCLLTRKVDAEGGPQTVRWRYCLTYTNG